MTWRSYALLALLGLSVAFGIAQFQHFPGYLDSDYYFGGGMQLASGKGFTEPYLWNYLDDPSGLPHPSHSYWMPLSSIIAAAGMWLTGSQSYGAGRLGFLVLAALAPVLTAALAYSFRHRRDLAMVSGLLAVFPAYYAPFMPVPDNYGPYLVLGALFFIVMAWQRRAAYAVLGALAGLMTLARSDGLLWLGLVGLVVFMRLLRDRKLTRGLVNGVLVVGGFLVTAGPWLAHTYSIYGTLLAPGGGHLLWLRSYDQTFIYPADRLTYQAWIAEGWDAILAARVAALRWNFLNVFAAQGEIFLLPFIFAGIWQHRQDERVQVALLAWLGLLLVMTLVFPFAGARGGFFHAGAAVQPMWWALAPAGLDQLVTAARRRNLFTPGAFRVFQVALVGIVVLMTGLLFSIRVLRGWGEGEQNYPKIEAYLETQGIRPGEVVMVRNPPGYYIMTGRPAIVVPLADETNMLDAARRYGAKYVIIEAAGATGPIRTIYDDKGSASLPFVGEVDGTRIFKVVP